MAVYKFFLTNKKAKTYKYVGLFILLLNLLVFGFIYFTSTTNELIGISLFGAIISLAGLLCLVLGKHIKYSFPFSFEICFILLAILWLPAGKYLLALCLFCVAIIGFYTNEKLQIIFTAEKISYPSFPKKLLYWQHISNAMLKDDILTIDLKNNKLIQVDIENGNDINEAEFNEFCKSKITDKLTQLS